MQSGPCGPLVRANRRASFVSRASHGFDDVDDGNWSTDAGYDGRAPKQPSMSAMRERLSMTPRSPPRRNNTRDSFAGPELSFRSYRSSAGPEGVGGQAVPWREPTVLRPDPPYIRQPKPPPPARQRRDSVPIQRSPSYERITSRDNPFIPSGPVYAPPQSSATPHRLAQRFGPQDHYAPPQLRQDRPRRNQVHRIPDEGYTEVPRRDQQPQRTRTALRRNDEARFKKQEALARRIGEEIAAVLDERLNHPRDGQQLGSNGGAGAGRSGSHDGNTNNTIAQLLAGLSQGAGNGFGNNQSYGLGSQSAQGPAYDKAMAYIADSMQRNQFLPPAYQSSGLLASSLSPEGSNGHNSYLQLIQCLLTDQTQLRGMVQDLQKDLQSLDGGSSTRSGPYAPSLRRAARSATEPDLESLGASSSLRSAQSAPVRLGAQRRGVDLLKQPPRYRRRYLEVPNAVESDWEKDSDDDYWDDDDFAETRTNISSRKQRAGPVYNARRAPAFGVVYTSGPQEQHDTVKSVPQAPTNSNYTRPYVEDEEEPTDSEEDDASEEEAEWSDFDYSSPVIDYRSQARNFGQELSAPKADWSRWRADPAGRSSRAATPGIRDEARARSSRRGGVRDFDVYDDYEDDMVYVPPPPRREGLYALNLQSQGRRARSPYRRRPGISVPHGAAPPYVPSVSS
ncbi:hypothetical protein Micbo1qcDRAFT_180935 [Microdochium bolleyi]|uniref:Uncharacterized protein n=1 Tax=Microdochium bolleyi TaxID=196109 RepID=A0A136IK22_9PEZI|nr:hypothetical protein Micbo1qcDRAFT_180935 [Microdochium bolleyi]